MANMSDTPDDQGEWFVTGSDFTDLDICRFCNNEPGLIPDADEHSKCPVCGRGGQEALEGVQVTVIDPEGNARIVPGTIEEREV